MGHRSDWVGLGRLSDLVQYIHIEGSRFNTGSGRKEINSLHSQMHSHDWLLLSFLRVKLETLVRSEDFVRWQGWRIIDGDYIH